MLVLFILSAIATASVQSCSLPSSSSELSWMVSIHKNSTKRLLCIGHIISKSFVLSFVDCYYRSPYVYLKGKDVYATSGWTDDLCTQVRHGKKVMAHPNYGINQHIFNTAILEIEDFDLDPKNPPMMPLPDSEDQNVANLADIMKHQESCQVAMFTRGLTPFEFDGRLPFRLQQFKHDPAENVSENLDYSIYKKNFTLIPRESCWIDHYCTSAHPGCLTFFQASRTFVCSALDKDEACRDDWLGAPVICGEKIVGLIKFCMRQKMLPLLISGINEAHLEAIKLYRNISKSDRDDQRGMEQKEEFPDIPDSRQLDLLPRA